MLKHIAVGIALAACAAMAVQVQVGAQQQGAPQRRAVGGTTAGNDAYPTDDQYPEFERGPGARQEGV